MYRVGERDEFDRIRHWELHGYADCFNVSPDALLAALETVGPVIADVKRELLNRRLLAPS